MSDLVSPHSPPDVREAAALALRGSTITDSSAALLLASAVDDSDPHVRACVETALEGTTITDSSARLLLAQARRRY